MKKSLILLLCCSTVSLLAMETNKAWDAELYDSNSKQQYQDSIKNMANFDLSDPRFKTIVELGCNSANVGNTIAQKYPNKTIVGIDPEQEAIDLGLRKHAQTKNLRLICSSAQKYKLQNNGLPPADFVGCYHVLHWIAREDYEKVFDNITANLAENGILDANSSAKQEDTPLTKAVLRTILSFKWGSYIPSCAMKIWKGQNNLTLTTAPEMIKQATKAGLIVDRCEQIQAQCQFESKEEFTPWVKSILKPYGTESIFKNAEQDFVDDVVNLYCQEYNPVHDGSVEYRFQEIHLTAHKECQLLNSLKALR